MDTVLHQFLNSIWAIPAAIGFALFFNVRKRALVGVGLLAFIGRFARDLLIDSGVSVVGASFLAALAIGAIAFTIGPLTGEASPVYMIAPVIPLIPGIYIFNALAALVAALGEAEVGANDTGHLIEALSAGLIAAAVTLALAIGTTAPNLLLLRHRRKPESGS